MRRRRLSTALTVALAGALLVAEAGRFLTYAGPVRPADAAVLLIGQDLRARRLAAHELLCTGQTHTLVIPAYGRVFACRDGRVVPASPPPHRSLSLRPPTRVAGFAKWAENTHLELLLARRTVERLGLRSIIFVSSPYHTRRIRLIADRVLEGFDTQIFATPYERTRGWLWWTSPHEIHWVLSEYAKIAWFLIYAPFFERPQGQ